MMSIKNFEKLNNKKEVEMNTFIMFIIQIYKNVTVIKFIQNYSKKR